MQEDIFEGGHFHPDFVELDPLCSEQVNYLGDQRRLPWLCVAAIHDDLLPILLHASNAVQGFQGLGIVAVLDGQDHAAFCAQAAHQRFRRIQRHHAPVVYDCHAVAQLLCFFHQVSGQKDGAFFRTNLAQQFPDCLARLRVEAVWSAHQKKPTAGG